ncbi:MAG TPA: DUF885 domain-containing protein [Gemmatimonadales bacterium]
MASTSLEQLTTSYLDLRWHLNPVDASAAGLVAHDGRLGSFTDGEVGEHAAALRALAAAIEAFDLDALDDEIDRTALLNEIRFTVHYFTVERPHQRDPGFWLSHVLEGLYQMLAARDRPITDRAAAAAERLRLVPGFLERARETLDRCPRVFIDVARGIGGGGRALIDEVAKHLRPADDETFDAACADARDALRHFDDALTTDLTETATDDFAIGADAFNYRLRFQHALQPTATELMRYGRKLVEQVEVELASMAEDIAPGTAWPDLLDRLRGDHPSVEDLVGTYALEMERARLFVAERDLAAIPDGALDVIATPPFLQPLIPFAAYQPPGAFSADRTGWFYVSPPDGTGAEEREQGLRDHCVHEIPSTALHEGYPGHHLQFLNAQAQPRTIRRLLSTPVSVEGWALYCEEMMGEQGFYRSTEEHFLQRVALLWRAVRVVLDVGLHTGSIGFDEAVRLLEHHVHFAHGHALAEVRRYCAEPAYQLAYAVGRRELRALRDDFQRAAGPDYSLRRFHDAVLAYGGLPVSLMRWGMGLG